METNQTNRDDVVRQILVVKQRVRVFRKQLEVLSADVQALDKADTGRGVVVASAFDVLQKAVAELQQIADTRLGIWTGSERTPDDKRKTFAAHPGQVATIMKMARLEEEAHQIVGE